MVGTHKHSFCISASQEPRVQQDMCGKVTHTQLFSTAYLKEDCLNMCCTCCVCRAVPKLLLRELAQTFAYCRGLFLLMLLSSDSKHSI